MKLTIQSYTSIDADPCNVVFMHIFASIPVRQLAMHQYEAVSLFVKQHPSKKDFNSSSKYFEFIRL